jgi:putative lipoprotein
LLFLAGIALVNLRGMRAQDEAPTISSDVLVANSWRPERLNGSPVDAESGMRLTFDAAGQVEGNTGCNRFFGAYELDGTAIRFGPLGTTRRACREPAQSFETAYLAALQSVTQIAGTDERLALSDASGVNVLRLVVAAPQE